MNSFLSAYMMCMLSRKIFCQTLLCYRHSSLNGRNVQLGGQYHIPRLMQYSILMNPESSNILLLEYLHCCHLFSSLIFQNFNQGAY